MTAKNTAIHYLTDGITVRSHSSVGCYSIYYITADYGSMCAGCVQDNLELCHDKDDPQWFIEHSEVNWESEIYCANCEEQIEASYGVAESESLYTIFRFYQERGREKEIVETGLTLDEAQAHCRDPNMYSDDFGWFDGYSAEDSTEVNHGN